MTQRPYAATARRPIAVAHAVAAMLATCTLPLTAHATLIATGSTQPSAATLNALSGPSASTTTQVFIGLASAGTLTLNGSSAGNGVTSFTANSPSGSGITAGFLGSGIITVDGAAGSATLSSTRAMLLGGLTGATGTLNVQNGGVARTTGTNFEVNVGGNSATGIANVSGAGSTLSSAGRINVGAFNNSNGSLAISAGGTVQTTGTNLSFTELVIGAATNATGTVTVTGTGSSLSVGGIIAGNTETGSTASLSVQNGAIVTSNQVSAGVGGGLSIGGATNATVSVTGAGSTLNVGPVTAGFLAGKEVVLGGFANGSLLIDNSGSVNAAGANVIVSGGIFGTQTGSAGLLKVSNGGTLTANTVTVNANGTLSGNGTVTANVVLNGGVISPGNSPGVLTINGDLTATAGTLTLELDSPSLFDVLAVSGNIFIGEDLLFDLVFGFDPNGQVFGIESFFTGFSSLNFDPDFNLNENVNVRGLGAGEFVTIAFGGAQRTFGVAAAAPEPGSIALILVAALAGMAMRRSRSARRLEARGTR